MIPALPPLIEDERAPALRDVIGTLMAGAGRCDFAVAHVRLGAIDFTAVELARVRCRLLLGRFDADQLADLGAGDAAQQRIAVLAEFLDSGRLEIRTGGLLRWYPDFSVHRNRAARESVALLGTHQLGSVPGAAMPRLTAVLTGPAVGRLARHFHRLWRGGHDVREVIRAELRARGGLVSTPGG